MCSNSHLTIWTFSLRATGEHHPLEYLVLDPQSIHTVYCRVEMKNRGCICPLLVRDGNRLKREWGVHPILSPARADFSIMVPSLRISFHVSSFDFLESIRCALSLRIFDIRYEVIRFSGGQQVGIIS